MAAAMDAGETPVQAAKPEAAPDAPKQVVEGEIKLDAEKPKGERERGPDGKFVKKAGEADPAATAEAKVDPAQPETAFSKAQKEEARQKSLLANFDKEKESVRAKAAELAEKEKQLAQATQQQRPEATLHGYTAREYWQAAQEFAKNGDHENAFKSQQAFLQIRQFESQSFAQQAQTTSMNAFKEGMDKFIKENSKWEFGDTPECRAVNAVLERFPQLGFLPDGFEKAVEVAAKFMDAESAAELRTKLEAAETELGSLRKATTPTPGGPAGHAKQRTFDQMSGPEQEAYLQRRATEADQQAA